VTREPKVPPAVEPVNVGQALSSDRDERRLIASLVRLLMRLPKTTRYALLGLAVAGGAEFSGLIDVILEPLYTYDPVEVRRPDRSHRADLRLERADAEELDR
jgi:hypothetical protein